MQVPQWFVTLSLWINAISYRDFFACAALYTALLYLVGEWHAALVFFFAMLLVLGTVGFLKLVTQVERPKDALVQQKFSRHAFPSGHAAASAFVATMVPYTEPWANPLVWALVLAFGALVVALSRLVLRVHTPTQVTIGLLLGVALPYLTVWFVDPTLTNFVLNMI